MFHVRLRARALDDVNDYFRGDVMRTPQFNNNAIYDLVAPCGRLLMHGSFEKCWKAMVNIYGDAPVSGLRKQGVKINKV